MQIATRMASPPGETIGTTSDTRDRRRKDLLYSVAMMMTVGKKKRKIWMIVPILEIGVLHVVTMSFVVGSMDPPFDNHVGWMR